MPVVLVVVRFPVADDHFGVEQAVELVHVQTFLTEPVVERLDEPVAPRLTRRNVMNADLVLAEPA